jgi:2',3'-cyclic-nucleotide 2'-phosphodiesterase (5'-nucleotidase family)
MSKNETVIRILATSDLHGKMVSWNYGVDQEDTHGSMAQLSEALRAYRTEQTVYIDAGDQQQLEADRSFMESRSA